eukprot:4784337-Ditylum_brightwellii.AAC.1
MGIAFKILEDDEHTPVGWSKVPSFQKCHVVCGAEFGLENIGKRIPIQRALYDPDVLMRPAIHSDESTHYQLMRWPIH